LPHTVSDRQNMTQNSPLKTASVKFAGSATKIELGDDFTSIIATLRGLFVDCFALPATRPLGNLRTTQTDFVPQYPTLKSIGLDSWLIFCERNEEQDFLSRVFGDLCFSVQGGDDPDKKESDILSWIAGDRPILISKPKIAGYGMNFQHCRNVVFASISFSYEQHYQSLRRLWRFGQERQVRAHIVISDTESDIWKTVNEKAQAHDHMKSRMAEAMREAGSTAATRTAYNRPLDLAFPDWIKGIENEAA
jgi:hypothetical protein